MHDLRTDITDALSEIPVLLSKTRIALDIFQASDELRQCSVELYVATLAALEHILSWYNEKAGSKLLASFTQLDANILRREICKELV